MNRRDFLKASVPVATSPLWLPHLSKAQAVAPLPPAGVDGWISLLNDRDLTGWYTMLQTSGREVAQGKKMVLIEQEMLHVMGNEIGVEKAEPGYIATNQEFENVHIRVEYKWGVKRFSPRNFTKRDNGLLYGLVGPDKVWPRCVECQIEEGDVGDYFLVDGIRGVQAQHGNGLFGQGLGPNGWTGPGPGPKPGAPPPEPTSDRKIKDGNFENLDDWNVVEVIWQGDRSAHIVNGRCVNVVSMLQQPDPQNPSKFIPLTRGKIAIEIEFAEIWYRRIEVKALA
jgi:3-keto-disaccharide hydrolase